MLILGRWVGPALFIPYFIFLQRYKKYFNYANILSIIFKIMGYPMGLISYIPWGQIALFILKYCLSGQTSMWTNMDRPVS